MNTVHEVLEAKFGDEIVRLRDFVSDGKCKSYEDYRFTCGQIQGLMLAQRETIDLLRKQMEADDE